MIKATSPLAAVLRRGATSSASTASRRSTSAGMDALVTLIASKADAPERELVVERRVQARGAVLPVAAAAERLAAGARAEEEEESEVDEEADEANPDGDAAATGAAAAAPNALGKFAEGERVYYGGASQTFASGNKLTPRPGRRGGASRADGGRPPDARGGVVRGQRRVRQRRALAPQPRADLPPPPGGFAVGETVFYAGPKLTFRRSGTRSRAGRRAR